MSNWDILKILPFFWLWTQDANGFFWCRSFRPNYWYHSLLPQKYFCLVIWDLGHFFVSLISPITGNQLIFKYVSDFEVPLFFNFLSACVFTFLFWTFLGKKPPIWAYRCSQSTQNNMWSEEDLFWKKPLPILISMTMFFYVPKWRMEV